MRELPVILDLEASGFGVNSYPIEAGVALADGSTACYLICPQPDWQHWDPASERLHGLTREQLRNFGRPVREVACSLNTLLEEKTVYSDAWGVDQSWLSRLFDAAGVARHFRLESLQSLFTETQYGHWNPTLEQVYLEHACARHRASHDARAIQVAFQRSALQTGRETG